MQCRYKWVEPQSCLTPHCPAVDTTCLWTNPGSLLPNKVQNKPPSTGSGSEANKAVNFPMVPNSNIMIAPYCTTLLLPTCAGTQGIGASFYKHASSRLSILFQVSFMANFYCSWSEFYYTSASWEDKGQHICDNTENLRNWRNTTWKATRDTFISVLSVPSFEVKL